MAFERVHLAAGARQTVTLTLTMAHLQLAEPATGDLYQEPGVFRVEFTNGIGVTLGTEVVLAGPRVLVEPFPGGP